MLATAVAAALTLSAADASAQTKGAATKAEVQSIQSQMQALAERLNRLEVRQCRAQDAELGAAGAGRPPRGGNGLPEVPDQGTARRRRGRFERDCQGERRRLGHEDQGPRRPPLPFREHLDGARGRCHPDCACLRRRRGRPLSPSHPRTTGFRLQGDRQRQGHPAVRHGRRRSAFVEPDAGQLRYPQVDRPRHGLCRLEVHAGRQPAARQAGQPDLQAWPEPVLRRRLQPGRRRRQVRPRHVLRHRLRLVAQ